MAKYTFKHFRRSLPSISSAGQKIAEHSFEALDPAAAENYARQNLMGDFQDGTDFADIHDDKGTLVMLEGA